MTVTVGEGEENLMRTSLTVPPPGTDTPATTAAGPPLDASVLGGMAPWQLSLSRLWRASAGTARRPNLVMRAHAHGGKPTVGETRGLALPSHTCYSPDQPSPRLVNERRARQRVERAARGADEGGSGGLR